jgi:hypothetical protein
MDAVDVQVVEDRTVVAADVDATPVLEVRAGPRPYAE